MSSYPKVVLKKGKEKPILRFHPWVFSGAIHAFDHNLQNGQWVSVCDHKMNELAIGHFYHGNIAVRILKFNPAGDLNQDFWNDKFTRALALRSRIGFISDHNWRDSACRLIHGEGDGLPGLICDYYGGHVIVQFHTDGMQMNADSILMGLQNSLGNRLLSVYFKSEQTLKGADFQDGQVYGEAQNAAVIIENGARFEVNWVEGQKTGFFLDQRDNRLLVRQLSFGQRVLNTFCYTGGFSVQALLGGAKEVVSVDVSAKAMQMVEKNLILNDCSGQHESVQTDVMPWISACEDNFDLVILDPPAFAKSIKARHAAVQAYKRLNLNGLKLVNDGGLLFTFSCSQVVGPELFEHTVVSAAMESGREVSILKRLGQSADHPVSAFHPEGNYLKGLLLYINK